jgi:hypothetical protein
MGKAKKSSQQEAKSEDVSDASARDPHAVLRQPANPPRPHVALFLIAAALFLAWFAYLVFVAWRG